LKTIGGNNYFVVERFLITGFSLILVCRLTYLAGIPATNSIPVM